MAEKLDRGTLDYVAAMAERAGTFAKLQGVTAGDTKMGDAVDRMFKAFAGDLRRLTATPDRSDDALAEEGVWQPIETAPRDRTEFLSTGGTQGRAGTVYPTRWLSPGPYSTENGKNTPGERRFQYPEGFYWAGYDGFVGPVDPTHWMPLPPAPRAALKGDGL